MSDLLGVAVGGIAAGGVLDGIRMGTSSLLTLLALGLLIPIGVLFVECLAAVLPRRGARSEFKSPQPRIAILVPAHNEALGIEATLRGLLPELGTRDRLVVVADNCEDDTAAIARQTGATVIERQDPVRRGKGYALDFGIRYLEADPPEVVVIVDADCAVAPGAIARIAQLSLSQMRPVQAVYLLEQPKNPKPKDAVSALAFLVKNLVRPFGLMQLRLPSLLTGTGMGMPWAIIRQVSLASGNIVEDMQLSLDLAIAGYPTLFCADARVTGLLPQQGHAAKSQRTRWEHGHLQTLTTQVPRLLKAGLQQRRFNLIALGLDLSIPPLSLLVMLWLAVAIVALGVASFGGWNLPVVLVGVEGILLLVAILAAWMRFGRSMVPLGVLLSVPLYVLWKIPLYLNFLVKPQTKWVRTDRDAADAPKS